MFPHSYVRRSESGAEARWTDWGATLMSLRLSPGLGGPPSVVLGSDSLEAYVAGFPAAAATIGRVANRIARSRFSLDGTTYELPANEGPHHLHGGPEGFSHRLWEAEAVERGGDAMRFHHLSADGEQGYPGNLDVRVVFTLADPDELRIDYHARTDRATPVNLTGHAYFNLAGEGDVLGHELWLDADGYTPVDREKIPTGEILSVSDTPFDFRSPRRIGERMAGLVAEFGGYDHNLVLREGRDKDLPCARLAHPASGLLLELFTTEPGIQLYTGNHFADLLCGGGRRFPRHGGVCLETQHFPDSPNQPRFPSVIVRPGESWSSTTRWRFRRSPPTAPRPGPGDRGRRAPRR